MKLPVTLSLFLGLALFAGVPLSAAEGDNAAAAPAPVADSVNAAMLTVDMKKIFESLVYLREEVIVDPAVAAKARRSVERMINLKN